MFHVHRLGGGNGDVGVGAALDHHNALRIESSSGGDSSCSGVGAVDGSPSSVAEGVVPFVGGGARIKSSWAMPALWSQSKAISQPTKSRPSWRAATMTVKEPAAGSMTKSPGSVRAAMRRLIRPIGFMWAWNLRSTFSGQRFGTPWSRQVRALIGGFCRTRR